MLAIKNIPASFHAKDLRSFFHDAVENNCFQCFHYLHRKEEDGNTCCWCPVKCKSAAAARQLIKNYNQRRWESVHCPENDNQDGVTVTDDDADDDDDKISFCFIEHFEIQPQQHQQQQQLQRPEKFATNAEKKRFAKQQMAATASLMSSSPVSYLELSPPDNLPQGNVGTPSAVLRALVGACLLPSTWVHRLGLTDTATVAPADAVADEEDIESKYIGVHDDAMEAWDLPEYEVSNSPRYDRNREGAEMLFENVEEIIWDKGSSGLVWHTDAAAEHFATDPEEHHAVDYSYSSRRDSSSSSDDDGPRTRHHGRQRRRSSKKKKRGRPKLQQQQQVPRTWNQTLSNFRKKPRRQFASAIASTTSAAKTTGTTAAFIDDDNDEPAFNTFGHFENYSKVKWSELLRQQGWKGQGSPLYKSHGLVEPIKQPKTSDGMGLGFDNRSQPQPAPGHATNKINFTRGKTLNKS